MAILEHRELELSSSEHYFRDLLDAFPAAVYTTDAEGLVTFYNRAAEELAGRTPNVGRDMWCISWRLHRPDGEELPLDQCPMAITLKEGRAVRNVEVIAERPDGARVPLMPFPTPLRDPAGNLIGAVNMLVDISALKRAEAAAAKRADEQSALYRFTDRLYRAESVGDIYEAALDAIFAALGCNRAAVLLCDDAGMMQFVAARGLSAPYQLAVSGHSPWKQGEADPRPIAIDDIETADLAEDLKAIVRDEGIGALAFVPLVANGGVIGKFMAYHDAPHHFSAEEIDLALTLARQLGFAIERERARAYRNYAEESQRNVEERFRAIVETTPECVKLVAADGALLHMNSSGLAMIGADCLERVAARSFYDVIAPEDRERFCAFNAQICGGERGSLEFDVIGLGGVRRHMETHAAPFRNSDGSIVQLAVTRDVSLRRRADEQRNLLINELNHRVKNTLATVQSLAMQTLRNTERSEDARALFDSRLTTLSRAHDLLTAQNWEGAGLREVVGRSLEPFRADEQRVALVGPDLRITPKQALALSIALHELATNAAKYGALSNDAGRVEVCWSIERRDNEHDLQLVWTESGGPRVEWPARRGFGSRLIERSLAHDLGGSARIEYRPEGVVSFITSPLEETGAGALRDPW